MASAGTAYLSIQGDFTPINKQLGASQNVFVRSLGQMEAKAKQSFTNIGGAAKTIGGAVQSQTGVVNSSLAGIKTGAASATGALRTVESSAAGVGGALSSVESSGASEALGEVGSQAGGAGDALGNVGGQSSGVTEALGEVSSQATGTADALGAIDDASQATTGSLASLDGRAVASAEALGEMGHHATSTSADMSKLQGRTDQTAGAARRSTRIHTNLGKSFNQAGQSVRRLAGGLFVAVSAYRAYSAAKTAVSVTGELARATLGLHRTTGLDIKSSSRWVAVMKARGASAASLSTSFGALARNTRSALDGSEKQRVAFRRLGITQGDLEAGTRDMEGLLERVADGFGNLKGGIDRADTAQKIFGRGGKDLLPVFAAGNKGLQQQLALADKYHVTFSGKSVKSIQDLIAAEKELKFAQLGLQTQFTQLVAPALTKGLAAVNDFARKVSGVMSRKDLTTEQKWDRVGGMIGTKLEAAIPEIANAAGRVGVRAVGAFIRGFINADGWGKIAIGAFLVSKLIGWQNIFRAAGGKGAKAFGSRFIPWMAAEGVAGGEAAAAGSAAPGPFRKWGSRAGRLFGVAMRVAALAAVAFIGFEIGKKIAEAIGKVTGGGLSASSREQVAAGLSKQGATDIRFSGSNKIVYTDLQGKRKTFVVKQRGGPIGPGMIPGHGDGDKVHVLAEPGEGFINKRAVKKMGGPSAIDAINRDTPRFQLGGVVKSQSERVPGLEGETTRADVAKKIRKRMRQVWDVTAPFFRTGDQMPSIRFKHKDAKDTPYAWVMAGAKRVNFSDRARRQFAQGDDWAEKALVHEWAHVFQTGPRFEDTFWEIEGGAEAFAQRIAPKVYRHLDIPFRRPPDAYKAETRRVRKEKSDAWILGGQFDPAKGPPGGKAGYSPARDGGTASASRRKDDPELPGATDVLSRSGRFVSTAYGPPWGGIQGTGITKTGIKLYNAPHKYIVAVDPNVIPLHSRLTANPNPFRRSGTFGAEDTGGAIKGNRIDFYDWRGRAKQLGWGRKYTNVSIKGKGGSVPSETKADTKGLEHSGKGGAPPFRSGSRVTRGDVSAIAREWNVNRAVASIGASAGEKFPGMEIMSGFRSGSITSSGNTSNHARHAALDLGTGKNVGLNRRMGTWVRGKFPKGLRRATEDVLDIDHDPNPPDHADHVHVAAFGAKAFSKALQLGAKDDSQKLTTVGGVTVKGKVTFQTLLDALGAKLESKLALAKLTPRKSDDLKFQNKLLVYWKGKLKLARKEKDYQGITEAAGQVGDYREQIKTTREATGEERTEKPLFKLDDLASLDAGTVKWNIAGLQPQLDRLQLKVAQAALTERRDAQDNITPDSYTDDISAADTLRAFWQNVYDATIGKVDLGKRIRDTSGTAGVKRLGDGRYAIKIKGKSYTFSGAPGQTVKVGKERVTIPGGPATEKRPGTVMGTVAQQTEAAGNLKSARDSLKSVQDEAKEVTGSTPDAGTSARDAALADLFKQQFEESQKRVRILEAQAPIFEQFKKAPRFDQGGIMPGSPQQHYPAWVAGQEEMTPKHKQGGGETVVLLRVEDGAVNEDKIKVIAWDAMSEKDRQMVRKARSGPAEGRKAVYPR